MPNNFLTPQIIANEALMVLQANLVMANLVHKDLFKRICEGWRHNHSKKPAKFMLRTLQEKHQTRMQQKDQYL